VVVAAWAGRVAMIMHPWKLPGSPMLPPAIVVTVAGQSPRLGAHWNMFRPAGAGRTDARLKQWPKHWRNCASNSNR